MRRLNSATKSYLAKKVRRQISRLRHKRGHGVHSPYIYNIVREVFMGRSSTPLESPFARELLSLGVKARRVRELENLRHHCGLSSFGVDSLRGEDIVVCTMNCAEDELREIVECAKKSGTTIVILSPHKNISRERMCEAIIDCHSSTSLNRRGYLVLFNNHLPKQDFIL